MTYVGRVTRVWVDAKVGLGIPQAACDQDSVRLSYRNVKVIVVVVVVGVARVCACR